MSCQVEKYPERLVVLSIDVPGKHEGGYVVWYPPDVHAPERYIFGEISFRKNRREQDDYRGLARVCVEYAPTILVMEHPFLHSIAQHIGGLKMWASLEHITWWMVGASKAKKLVLGKGRASKEEVKHWAEQQAKQVLTQHCADALLYLEAWKLSQWRHEAYNNLRK